MPYEPAEGERVFFDLGHGVEMGRVEEVLGATDVRVGIPLGGPRRLSKGELYPTATAAAEAAA